MYYRNSRSDVGSFRAGYRERPVNGSSEAEVHLRWKRVRQGAKTVGLAAMLSPCLISLSGRNTLTALERRLDVQCSLDSQMDCLERCQVDHCQRVGRGPEEGAGIQNQRAAGTVLLGVVRMTVADQVPLTGTDCFFEQVTVIAVQPGDLPPGQLQLSETPVAGLTRLFDRAGQRPFVVIDVAKHEVCGPGGEQRNDCRRPDIAAVDDRLDILPAQKADGRSRRADVSVRVADNGESHENQNPNVLRISKSHRAAPPGRLAPAACIFPLG